MMPELTQFLTAFLNKNVHAHFIDGQYYDGSESDHIEVINPATEEVVGKVNIGSKETVDHAVASAKKAFRHDSPWRKMSPDDRGKILHRLADKIEEHKESIAQLVTLENGKLLKDSRSSDAGGAAKTFRYYAGWCTKIEGETLDSVTTTKRWATKLCIY